MCLLAIWDDWLLSHHELRPLVSPVIKYLVSFILSRCARKVHNT